jgi:proline racemase
MPFAGPGTVSRNAVIVSPGRIDRSPCGTGTSARLAVLHARGQLAPVRGFIHESIIGSRFEAAIAGHTTVGRQPGIVPTIAGQAWITGVFQHGLDLRPVPERLHAARSVVRLIRTQTRAFSARGEDGSAGVVGPHHLRRPGQRINDPGW